MENKTYTTFDIARLLDVYPTTVANWVDGEKLKAFVTPGGHRRVKAEDLVIFLKKYNMPVPRDLVLAYKKRILVVDDDRSVRESIVRILRSKNDKYEVFAAGDGFQAGSALSNFRPDLVILDLMLPGIDGFRVCELIRQQDKKIKILAITGYSTRENKKKILAKGADSFLSKPFEMAELMKKMEKLLV